MASESTSVAAQIERLRESAMACEKCELSQTRTTVVFGEGNPATPLVIIGEGPGENEDATGRPFVGRAGALLDQAMREAGLTRKHVYITNIVKCRPYVVDGGRTKNRPPRVNETSACLPWLEQTIATIQPLVILCLGAPAANAIIHKDFRISHERGKFFETKYARYAIAALHPAYILRQDGEMYEETRASLVTDILNARKKVIESRNEPSQGLF
jgi:uracil-DNA glycosylase